MLTRDEVKEIRNESQARRFAESVLETCLALFDKLAVAEVRVTELTNELAEIGKDGT